MTQRSIRSWSRESAISREHLAPPERLEERCLLTVVELVGDINPGSGSSDPRWLTNADGALYFNASSPPSGRDAWLVDDARQGARRITDFNSGSLGGGYEFTGARGLVFFRDDGSVGSELWKTDGTPAGTEPVADIWSTGGEFPTRITPIEDSVVFAATDGSGEGLWRSDGTESGTIKLRSFGSRWSVSGYPFAKAGDIVYVSGYTTTEGRELWRTDGTVNGTDLVRDIRAGSVGSAPKYLTNVNGTLFFSAYDDLGGIELWKSDGSTSGTVRVKDITPGHGDSTPRNLTNVNGTLFFTANNGTNGEELWKSNGTETGTILVRDVTPGLTGSTFLDTEPVNSSLYFLRPTPTDLQLWKSDGSSTGTVLVRSFVPNYNYQSGYLTSIGSDLFFIASEPTTGGEVWTSDGTSSGTRLYAEVFPGPPGRSWYLTAVGNVLYFVAQDNLSGFELWRAYEDVTPPQVIDVAVSGSHWGPGVGRHSIPTGSGVQLTSLAWSTIDRISIKFSEDVDLTSNSLTLAGLNTPDYRPLISGYTYSPTQRLATWTFSQPIPTDQLTIGLLDLGGFAVVDRYKNRLDGDWDNPTDSLDPSSSVFPSGNGTSGGVFAFRIDVLPGDGDHSRLVNGGDYTLWTDHFGMAGGNARPEQGDFNGDGFVTGADYTIWSDHFDQLLPGAPDGDTGGTISPASLASAVTVDSMLVRTAPRDANGDPQQPVLCPGRAVPSQSMVWTNAREDSESRPSGTLVPSRVARATARTAVVDRIVSEWPDSRYQPDRLL